jgi:hypothetical protein
MWIVSDKDVSYRAAVGRVVKDAWNKVATEWIDVTLG